MKENITKLLMGTITKNELVSLKKWLDHEENQLILEKYIREYHDLNLATLRVNVDEAYKKVVSHMDSSKRRGAYFPFWARIAATLLLLIGTTFFVRQYFPSPQHITEIAPHDESITLKLDNGTVRSIDAKGIEELRDADGNLIGTQEKNRLKYSRSSQTKVLEYNTLSVPNGKRFQVEMSDGTIVHLNSGSSLRYPVNFLPTGNRVVYLLGEAYFEVKSDPEKPFILQVDALEIEVTGTEFNVSAFIEDNDIDVVLVEGVVSMNSIGGARDASTRLLPGQKGSFGNSSKNISVNNVNTRLYTSWIDGHLVFRDLTFDNILKKMERHYSIEIVNTNAELGKEVFNASFDKVDIEAVLGYFNETHAIAYVIENNKVIIK